jgi:aminoglycoside 3-N-acetyltransferase
VTGMLGQSEPPDASQDRQSLCRDLRALGVRTGQVLLAHASMRWLGPVQGGAVTVVAALRDAVGSDAVGSEGTVAMSTGTAGNSDTSRLYLARTAGMTAEQVRRYQAAMPPFDPATTPSEGMGRIAEQLRTTPGAVRSAHPQSSFAAVGPMAHKLMDGHAIDCHLGGSSPLARLYEVGAWILLLGVGYPACAAFHLAEYRYVASPPMRSYRCVIGVDGRTVWHEYRDVVLDDRDLGDLGADFERTGIAIRGRVGQADCRLAPMVPTVDFATEWLRQHRHAVGR